MVLTTIFLLTIVGAWLLWKRKNLFILEFLAFWCFIAILNQNLLDIAISNLELMEIGRQKQMFWASFVNRFFFIPILISLFIDFFSVSKSYFFKMILSITWVVLLSGLDYFVRWIGILKVHQWESWWSLISWCCIILATLGCRKFLHYLLLKGKNDYDFTASRKI